MIKGMVGAFIVVVVLSTAALWWNNHSPGGLVRALGGSTSEQLAEEIAKHPGPAGPAGPPGPAPIVSLTIQSPQDFDKSSAVPGSATASFCTISKIVTHRSIARADRSCELTPGAQRSDPWQIIVNDAVCGVSCFTIVAKK
jgi:hypothetical protein